MVLGDCYCRVVEPSRELAMTTPDERTRSIVQTREFLRALCDSEQTSGVPDDVRREARRLLRHYPWDVHLDAAAVAWPDTWTPTRPVPGKTMSYAELIACVRSDGSS